MLASHFGLEVQVLLHQEALHLEQERLKRIYGGHQLLHHLLAGRAQRGEQGVARGNQLHATACL